MENKKEEELQSRREFFKSAAKAALPVLGAIVLTNVPIIKANAATDCYGGGCMGYCSDNCTSSCQGSCRYSCQGSCSGKCQGSCAYNCGASAYFAG